MSKPISSPGARIAVFAAVLVLLVLGFFALRRHPAQVDAASTIDTELVKPQDISQTVEATGTVQAIEVIEIKSKASGQILKMPVEIGSVVKSGDLLAQIDPLTARNQYNQALAAAQAAEAAVTVTSSQKKRADALLSQEAITAVDHEAAVLAAANAQSSLAKTRSDLSIAKQALDDATVRAPSDGTVIEQDVTKGMVITSATQSPSGGTTILKMADLSRIEMNVLVGETDIGALAPGMNAKVTVDAFPNHTFTGRVLKIEPQAVVQQSVTMFPVLVAIDNENGRLLPGMNGEVTIDIANRKGVLAVPLDAIRSMREAPTVAASLGMNADSLKADLQRQLAAFIATRQKAGADSSARGRGGDGAGASSGRRHRNGASAMAASATGGAGGTGGGGAGGAASRAARAQFVMVQTPSGFAPRLVRIGISDFDNSEVLAGLTGGERVALLSVAEQAAKRKQQQAQIAQRVGNGMPGSTTSGGGRSTGGGR